MSAERKPAQDARFDSSLSMDSTNKFAVAKNVLPVLTPLVPPELSRIVELSQELMQSVTGTSTVPLKIGTGVQRSLTAMASVVEDAAQRAVSKLTISSHTKRIQN